MKRIDGFAAIGPDGKIIKVSSSPLSAWSTCFIWSTKGGEEQKYRKFKQNAHAFGFRVWPVVDGKLINGGPKK